MKCHDCGTDMVCKTEIYHYKECGLDNVFLEGVDVCACDKCGEKAVRIPCMPDLHKLIAKRIVFQKQPLGGNEIRFLRKNAGLSATRLAELIGVRLETVSRWESENINVKPAALSRGRDEI